MVFEWTAMRIYIGQINPTVGDITGNTAKILAGIEAAKAAEAKIALFPELALTGYIPQDLLLLPHFMDVVEEAVKELATATYGITAVVGMPRSNRFKVGKHLHNSAAVITNGRIVGYHDKLLLPTYDLFEERRYFEPGVRPWLWDIDGTQVAITICEDIWLHSELITHDRYTRDPIKELRLSPQRPAVVLNLSASPYSLAKAPLRMLVAQRCARALHCPVVLCNQVGANDSLIFDGTSLAVAYDGTLLHRCKSFAEDGYVFDTDARIVPIPLAEQDVLEDLFQALILGIRDYFRKTNHTTACLGLSGGIDSAVVACLAVHALGKENVVAVSLPSRYSSPESVTDAEALATTLGISLLRIPIDPAFITHLKLLQPQFHGRHRDVTEENLQSRIRGTLLMALANKFGHLLLNTGNKSEIAVGYTTLYGDMCGSLSVIGDLTKRRVYALAHWINRHDTIIPQNTLTKPPSAELRENQRDSDTLPDYEYIDTVIEEYLEYRRPPDKIVAQYGFDPALVDDLIQRIHKAEYKRRQGPPILRITDKCFSVGHHFPIAQGWK